MTMSRKDIIEHRKKKFLNIGRDKCLSKDFLSSDDLFSDGVSKIFDVRKKIKNKKIYFFLTILAIGAVMLSLQLLFQ